MKWLVMIGYKKFVFDTIPEAGTFAQVCIDHRMNKEDEICIKPVDENMEGEEV